MGTRSTCDAVRARSLILGARRWRVFIPWAEDYVDVTREDALRLIRSAFWAGVSEVQVTVEDGEAVIG